jgi:hypothetical protein
LDKSNEIIGSQAGPVGFCGAKTKLPEPSRVGQIFLTSRHGFAAYLIQVLVITSQPFFRARWDLFCCDNHACLPQYNKQVTQSVGEFRSLAIGVSRRDAFVELIDVTADGRSPRIAASPAYRAIHRMSGIHVANHFTTVALALECLC